MMESPLSDSAEHRVWDEFLTDEDRGTYHEAGYGKVGGGGLSPALVVVDVTYQFTGDRPEPVRESIRRFPDSCGEAAWRAIPRIAELLAAFRDRSLPVFYTKSLDHPDRLTLGSWLWKKDPAKSSLAARSTLSNQIPQQVAPRDGERVIQKTKPSAFFGTPLLSYLVHLGVDTLVVAGTTTSGCVRATVLDSFSFNFRTIVAEDAVFDRIQSSHAMNCFDMNAKYADVASTREVVDYLEGLVGPK